jgi:hypothetical protein
MYGAIADRPNIAGEITQQAGRSVQSSLQQIASIVGKLNQQRDANDVAIAEGTYIGQIKDLHNKMITTPELLETFRNDPGAYGQYFIKEEKIIREGVALGLSKEAKTMFGVYAESKAPALIADARYRGIELYGQAQVAKLDKSAAVLSFEAARASNAAERNEFINKYHGLVDKAEKDGTITPVEAEKRRQDFNVKAQTDWMTIIGKDDPDLLLKMENETNSFVDVPPLARATIIDRAMKERDSKLIAAQAALKQALTNHRESVERMFVLYPENRTREYLEEWRDYLTSEKLVQFEKMIDRDFNDGDPATEHAFQPLVYNPNLDPQATLDRLNILQGKKLIGDQKHQVWANHLQSQIDARRSTARSDKHRAEDKAETARTRDETRVREIVSNRFQQAMSNVDQAFRTTGGLSLDFDGIAAEAVMQAREEIQRRAHHLGEGGEDALLVQREVVANLIPHVQMRAQTRLMFLQGQLKAKTANELKEIRGRIGDDEYYNQARIMQEISVIQSEMMRLQKMQTPTRGRR